MVKPRIIAHRGASHDAPQNTFAAFTLAFSMGADGIEGDFHLTRDGRLVCIHDFDTAAVSDRHRIIADTDLAELRRIDVGSRFAPGCAPQSIPTLEEVIALLPPGKHLVAELKIGPHIVDPLVHVLMRRAMSLDRLTIISFNDDTLTEVRRRLPAARTHLLRGYRNGAPTADQVADDIARVGATGFGSAAQTHHFNDAFVALLRERGVHEFHVWVANDIATADYYRRLGAWGITTDRPDVLAAHWAAGT